MDIKSSDLGLLVSLDAMLAECNVSRAAERLHISQPAASAQLARLRDLFNDPLLVSSGRQMVPTNLALEIMDPLHHLLEELAALVHERRAFDPSNSERRFRIIATDYLHRIITLPLGKALAERAPGMRIAALAYNEQSAWSMLENAEADILLMSRQRTPQAARHRLIYTDRLCLVQRRDHPRGRKKIRLAEFCSLAQLHVSPEGGDFTGEVDVELEKLDRKRNVVASVPSFLLAPSLLAETDLVAMLPQRLAALFEESVETFDFPFFATGFDILCSWHPRMQQDPAHRWLRELLVAPFATPEN